VHTEKSLAAILAETKEEITRFITTRVSMLKAETEEKVRKLKAVIPLIVVALALLIAGWMALTFALIALLHALFLPSIYSWLWAGLIVGGLYVAIGIVIGQMAIGRIKATSLTPSRTLTVLKQDKVWIQNEARTA
jgi:Putative Actinobacterial Holin-X, holin superfamily III